MTTITITINLNCGGSGFSEKPEGVEYNTLYIDQRGRYYYIDKDETRNNKHYYAYVSKSCYACSSIKHRVVNPDEPMSIIIKFDLKPMWVYDKDTVKLMACTPYSDKAVDDDFNIYNIVKFDNVISLNNGKFLINDYGKYASNLSFIHIVPAVQYEHIDKTNLNLPKGDLDCIYGDYFVSKKGTKCFRILPKDKANHILIRDDWGGCFNSYRGRTLPKDDALYYRRAASNGGGSGYDFAIYPKDWKYSLSENDI